MAAGEYGDKGKTKLLLDLDQENTKYDEEVDFCLEAGRSYLEDLLFLHSATLPLTGDQKTSADKVAEYHACVVFKTRQKAASEEIREWRTLRDEAKDALIAKLKAQPSTNTQSQAVAYASTYRSEPLASRDA